MGAPSRLAYPALLYDYVLGASGYGIPDSLTDSGTARVRSVRGQIYRRRYGSMVYETRYRRFTVAFVRYGVNRPTIGNGP